MGELDRNKEYITSNLSEERRVKLLDYLSEENIAWGTLGVEELLDCVLICKIGIWHSYYEREASSNAIDANTLFEELTLDKNFSYYLGDLNEEQLEKLRLEVIKDKHAIVFKYSPMRYKDYLVWNKTLWITTSHKGNQDINALSLFDIPDKSEANDLNNSFKEETEKQQFFFYNSKKHGPNFYTKEDIPFHNGEEWKEDLVVYTQLGSGKKFITTKERFKKFKEVWI